MTASAGPVGTHGVGCTIRKLRNLGLDDEADLQAFVALIKTKADTGRGKEIMGAGTSHSTVLLDGVACSCESLEDGRRQIYAFQLPGDFCDLHRYVLPEQNGAAAVVALTDCSVGIIRYCDLDRTLARHPKLGLALWRATLLEASISRTRIFNVSRRPALQRVAHLLCELLARRETIGINGGVIPLSQIDLADATGLSVVHLNRTTQGLRALGVLSQETRAIEVMDRERLLQLANFDDRYLNMAAALSHWKVEVDGPLN